MASASPLASANATLISANAPSATRNVRLRTHPPPLDLSLHSIIGREEDGMSIASLAPDRVDYLPMIDRPIIKWPNGARVAFWVAPNIEHYEYLPPLDGVRNPWPRTPLPDAQQYSMHEYGNRVGFWRLLPILDHYGIRCSTTLNIGVLEHFPDIAEEMLKRDWVFVNHGFYNTRFITTFSEEQERELFRRCRKIFRSRTGREIK